MQVINILLWQSVCVGGCLFKRTMWSHDLHSSISLQYRCIKIPSCLRLKHSCRSREHGCCLHTMNWAWPESKFSFHACVCLLQRVCFVSPFQPPAGAFFFFLVLSTTSPLLTHHHSLRVCRWDKLSLATYAWYRHRCGLFKTWLRVWLCLIRRHLVLDSGAHTLGVLVLFHWGLLTEYQKKKKKKTVFIPSLHLSYD